MPAVGGGGACAWMASKVYEHTSLDATRRQLSRFGLAGAPEQDKNPETGTQPKAEDRPPDPEPKAPPTPMNLEQAAEPPPEPPKKPGDPKP